MAALEDVAHRLSVRVSLKMAGTLEEMDTAYDASSAARDEAVFQMASPLAFENQPHFIALAARLHLPVIYETRYYVENGGLIPYGQVWQENFERSASLVENFLRC